MGSKVQNQADFNHSADVLPEEVLGSAVKEEETPGLLSGAQKDPQKQEWRYEYFGRFWG